MPLEGEYEPSRAQFVRDQVDLYERSRGTEGTTLQDLPAVILATLGAKSGKIRKTPLMLAREVTGDEKSVWWARAVEAFAAYAEYQKNVDREIPVLVLEPATHQARST
jgi:hypothetical protein